MFNLYEFEKRVKTEEANLINTQRDNKIHENMRSKRMDNYFTSFSTMREISRWISYGGLVILGCPNFSLRVREEIFIFVDF